jgi:hypothetical protein
MTQMHRGWALAIVIALLAMTAGAGEGAATKERTCFYHASSGWGLWATRNVGCKAARRVCHDATKRITPGIFNRTIRVDGYSCKMRFDGGGHGTCTASHRRRITFSVP